jgi:ATP-binding cassette subfamily E protein 1
LKKNKRELKNRISNRMSTRIAIVNEDKCKPNKCNHECKRICPVVKMGKECIKVEKVDKKTNISEILCNGCGLCVKKCPFNAIKIINLPKEILNETTHRYGENSFKLHRLPQPRPGQVLGLIGSNGTGKSTALKILSGLLKPNLGEFKNLPEWKEILNYFRGSEIQNYLGKISNKSLQTSIKLQFIDLLPKVLKGDVYTILQSKDEMNLLDNLINELDLNPILNRDINNLSGGELQRFSIALTILKQADSYIFDEPTSYLDIKQRLKVSQVIRRIVNKDNYVIVVEHDLAVLDYLSDMICCLYGEPGGYGVITTPYSVREGINIFLDGFIPTENVRFREYPLSFNLNETAENNIEIKHFMNYSYPNMTKTYEGFKIEVEEGGFRDSEIIVLLGENGTGKTTFIQLLAGIIKPDNNIEIPELKISFKPQKIKPIFNGNVKDLLYQKIGANIINDVQFKSDVIKPLNIEDLFDKDVINLSGGELQRVAIVLTLGKPADIYLLDEPSAYLDSEQRINASKVIKRFIMNNKKTAFVVEHDFMMATYLADKIILFEGKASENTIAKSPDTLLNGMNKFLRNLEITFRRDPENKRPRINKLDSIKDKEQKLLGQYFFIEN